MIWGQTNALISVQRYLNALKMSYDYQEKLSKKAAERYQNKLDLIGIYSSKAMDNFKSLDAYKFFIDGWVQTIKHQKLPGGAYILYSEFRPSFRTIETCVSFKISFLQVLESTFVNEVKKLLMLSIF
ncbi:uncharacterized protein LOC124811363 [Hydra vulgaris]|uniref:uncharacterized protein LOC124811363 n=1 Tax=Hydra vulgaris TaxID=6087 RepID=UPI001F5E67A1|nr:uncharacterized protein LOC124811363 [Hydra vulgaris]